MIAYFVGYRIGWFRVFGYGLHWADRATHPPLFSERTGARRRLHFGSWSIGVLRPGRPA